MSKKVINILSTVGAIFIYILLGWTIIIPTLVTKFILEYFYKVRVTDTIICDDIKYYPGLKEIPRYFMSKNNKLYGAFFEHEGHGPFKGVVIVSHGIGCSHKNYIQVIDYFTRKDYLVFAFDMSGCCQSEGGPKQMEGLQRAIIDLKSAIMFVSEQEESKDLDLFVFGHSWSGYAAACVLNEDDVCPKIKALATLAGFNTFWGPMKDQGARRCGKIIAIAKPFAYLASRMTFGKYAAYSGIDGINNYKGPVYVAHSLDDSTVKYIYSIERHRDECTNPKAEFHKFDGLGHTLYRPVWAEKSITEKRAGKEPLKQNGENVFQYFMDDRYRFSLREEVFGLDEDYMDTVEEFYERARKEC